MLAAELDTILFSDVDLSTPIEEALALMKSIEEGADVVIGSRRFDGEKQVRRSWPRRLMAWGWRTLVHLLVLEGIHDTQCGFKMFRREAAHEVLARQRLEGWAFDVEVLYLARRLGYEIAEVPVEWHEAGDSRLGFFSPFWMALDLLKVRRLHRNLRREKGGGEGED
jgi:dolichyl-phosphate beta-glucosyltransferase